MGSLRLSFVSLTAALVSIVASGTTMAQLGNAWHIPNNTVPTNGANMRTPLSNIDTGTTVTIYNGNQFQGSGNPGNQSGGTVFYKAQSSNGPYSSVPLGFFSQSGNDKFWVANFTAPPSDNGVIQYYLQINYTDHANTFLYGNNSTSNTTGTESVAASSPFTFQMNPTLTVNSVNANYTTEHLYIDEIAGDSIPVNVVFNPNVANVDPVTVQVYTNLNRRDLATLAYTDGNGLPTEEGISPPSGDVIGTNDNHYYKAYAMSASGGQYIATLNAQKTGAYRMTARYRLTGSGTWNYYTTNGRRDHALVVSPKGARDINLYEVNTLNIDATGDQMNQRSTFADLHNNSKRWNLNYLKNLGCNYLWFQPIHPNGIDGRQIDPNTSQPFTVGSPYAVKNFFQVMELMGASNTRSGALSEFQSFVTDADAQSVGIMLDAPFNHTSYDAELAQQGVTLIKPGANTTDQIRNVEGRFYSHGDIFNASNNNYCARAAGASDIAPAPDRNDFGKFGDTFDVFFGNYSALVCHNDADDGNYLNENDVFNYADSNWNGIDFVAPGSVNNNITRNVWRYFAAYVPYWLTQTGHSGVNSTSANGDYATRLALDSKGIDALRADFGQGLPPQCWEYIINVARSHKWNFVFMTESLDGGAVTYRSARHFDILNENIIFPFKAATQTSDYRGIFDGRRSAYGQGLVLLNNTSHDEENYDDPFQALIRYGVCNSIDGAPMIFYGQENGVTRTFGYSHYETNFGKQIPHFKVFNDLGPIIGNPGSGAQFLYPVYAAMGQARQFSTALRSSNRYYLNQVGGSIQPSIFSVAKYETANASPASHDVVFAFMNLDRNNDQQGNFDVNITQNSSNLFGIKSSRTYDVKNIAAYTGSQPNRRDIFLNRKTGAQLLSSGLFVGLNKVPTMDSSGNSNDPAWNQRPFEAQYLKLYDVTAPSTTPGAVPPPHTYSYFIGATGTINWGAAASDGEVTPCYKVSVTINGNTTSFVTCGTSAMISGTVGQTATVVIQTVNPSDNNVTGPASAPTDIKFIDPNADDDGDGVNNSKEDVAGTNPFDSHSVFQVTNITRPDPNNVSITWNSVNGKKYFLQSANSPGGTYMDVGTQITASEVTANETVPATIPAYYRVRIVP
jgi:alpha amylase-like protein